MTQCKLAHLPSFSNSHHARVRPGLRPLRRSWAGTRSSAVVPKQPIFHAPCVPATFRIAVSCCANSGQNRAISTRASASLNSAAGRNSLSPKALPRVPSPQSRVPLNPILYEEPNNSNQINNLPRFYSLSNSFASNNLAEISSYLTANKDRSLRGYVFPRDPAHIHAPFLRASSR